MNRPLASLDCGSGKSRHQGKGSNCRPRASASNSSGGISLVAGAVPRIGSCRRPPNEARRCGASKIGARSPRHGLQRSPARRACARQPSNRHIDPRVYYSACSADGLGRFSSRGSRHLVGGFVVGFRFGQTHPPEATVTLPGSQQPRIAKSSHSDRPPPSPLTF